jgi:hypothetical protein
MKSVQRGGNISPIEVTNISEHGFWVLLAGEEELFLPYSEFPWFKDAPVAEIRDVELLHGRHLYWRSLDIDLSLDSIRHPERYPLKSRADS